MLDVDRLGEHQICPDAVCLRDTGLSLDQRQRQRTLIGAGISRALEQQSSVRFVLAVHDDGVVTLRHQLLDGSEGFINRLNLEVEFAENLGDDSRQLLVETEQ